MGGGCTFYTYHPFWAWRQEGFQACEYQESSSTRWYQWVVPQTMCWLTSAGVHNDIQPVPGSVCHTHLLQEVHHHSSAQENKTSLFERYCPVALILSVWNGWSRPIPPGHYVITRLLGHDKYGNGHSGWWYINVLNCSSIYCSKANN